jgi:integral membrane protein
MTTFRLAVWIEGLSLLVLLLVAMPLKYAANLPGAVRVVGALHGLLFVILAVVLYRATIDGVLKRRSALHALVLATIPFGFLAASRVASRVVDHESARTTS